MNLIVRVFGHEVLNVSTEPAVEEEACYDLARDLSGGTTSYDRIDAGDTDRYMGFTNGRAE